MLLEQKSSLQKKTKFIHPHIGDCFANELIRWCFLTGDLFCLLCEQAGQNKKVKYALTNVFTVLFLKVVPLGCLAEGLFNIDPG